MPKHRLFHFCAEKIYAAGNVAIRHGMVSIKLPVDPVNVYTEIRTFIASEQKENDGKLVREQWDDAFIVRSLTMICDFDGGGDGQPAQA